MAAPVAPSGGMSTKSSTMPRTSDTSGPADERPGAEEPTSALEKIASAANPSAPGSSHRNGAAESLEPGAEDQRDQLGPDGRRERDPDRP